MSEQTFAPDRELDEALALLHDRGVGPLDVRRSTGVRVIAALVAGRGLVEQADQVAV